MKLIETNWLEKEKKKIIAIPPRFRSEFDKGALYICEKILSTQRIPYVFTNHHEKITRKSKEFSKELEKFNKVVDICTKELDTTREEIVQRKRNKEIIYLRHLTLYACKLSTRMTLRDIGKEIGGLDHTTVINAISAAKDIIDTDSYYNEIFYKILEKAKCVK